MRKVASLGAVSLGQCAHSSAQKNIISSTMESELLRNAEPSASQLK